ncbi:DUF2301 domain-containing membrane protein [Vibrio sp. ZSDZ65]|uniref:DUF2301 domain-containing membrane protein n=1 Tax=Vibrio qingdaonensis TaxID=2829491 RepID=A0A9X3HVN7_9VIBR|nr:DUF2301 domain-containing membrane protein [Vibrio qingdaonensis]MCW8345413.1 DUF2301 domain-containing membrane protein [Vibrio qingdaonensis]
MANPEHREELDKLDKVSVCFYRFGISLFSIALFGCAFIASHQLKLITLPDNASQVVILVFCLASVFTAANLHVYSKHVRAIIVWSTWLGLLIMLYSAQQNLYWLALGFFFVTFSGIALKESFCFKVYGLKLVPLFLAMNTLFILLEYWQGVLVCSSITGLIMMYLAVQKWRMPLHFDIGIKANYEI